MPPPDSKPSDGSKPKTKAKPARAKSGAKAKSGAGSRSGAKAKPKPRPADDLWFRFSTRIRAGGYWLREKSQMLGRALAAGGRRLGDEWMRRPAAVRRSLAAVLALAVAVLAVRLVPIPGVPCQISAVKECAPSDGAVALVPADALLYAHLTLDRDTTQFERADELSGRLPGLTLNAQRLISFLPTPSGAQLDFSGDVAPWATDDLALELVPAGRRTLPAVIIGVGDRQAAEDFVSLIAPPANAEAERQSGEELNVYPDGFAAAFTGDNLVIGQEGAVRASLRVGAGGAQGLDGAERAAPRDQLPERRFADVFVSRAGVDRLLAGGGSGSTQLDTFVDYGATLGFAASATAEESGVDVQIVSDLDPKRLKSSPSFFTELPEFEPDLAGEAGERTLGYIGLGEIGPTVAGLVGRAGSAQPGIGRALRGLARDLERSAGVDPLRELLPALGGQAALVAEPTDGVPFASLIVEGVDEERAASALARLQKPLLEALSSPAEGRVPSFEERTVDGIAIRSVRISPSVNLSYAIFDDKLVISTDPAGIAQVRSGDSSLADTAAYEDATGELPGRLAAIVFLNIHELQDRAELAGLGEDPVYASLSEDISEFAALALGVTSEDERIRTEIFLAYH